MATDAPPMRIRVDRLATTPTDFAFEGDRTWWEASASPGTALPPLAGPLVFRVSAYRMGEDVYLEGDAAGTVELECARCVARYRHALREPLRLVLEPAGSRVPAEPDAAADLARTGLHLGDELEAGWFRGDEIDLSGFFFEVVSLGLPVQPLCREDCPGLCPRCGADRADGPCGCTEARPGSPFAVLAALRHENTKGGS